MKPFRISYKVFPDAFGAYVYSAMLDVQLALPDPRAPRTRRIEMIIDSGATRCLFHSDLAKYLGIDAASCPIEQTTGIGGVESTYLHEVMICVPGGSVLARAGFKENLPVAGLLGMNGFFEHFRILFDGPGRYCDLERLFKA